MKLDSRVHSIDVVRGIVMIIMVLDHVRDFLHVTSVTQSPTDLTTTSVWLFFTRWITHLCAPTFVFLSGTSAFLSLKNRENINASRRFLFTRGMWLVVLEFTLVNFGVWFDVHFSIFLVQVIAAIGIGFMGLSFLLGRKPVIPLVIGLIIIFFHGLIQFFPLPKDFVLTPVINGLILSAPYPIGQGHMIFVAYAPIAWMGIMFCGYASGKYFLLSMSKRKSLFWKIGLGSLSFFCLMRYLNAYGDPAPWSFQKTNLFTFLSFINVSKYPPSLDFCLLFLGFMFLLLALFERPLNRFMKFTEVYGRVPMFFYLLHLYIIHPLLFILIFARGYHINDLIFGFNFGRPESFVGLPLWAIYLIWFGVWLVLYPLCKKYGTYKMEHREKKWLRYL